MVKHDAELNKRYSKLGWLSAREPTLFIRNSDFDDGLGYSRGMPFDRRTGIEARLARYRLIEQRLLAMEDSNTELRRLQRVIADLELQLKELDE